MADKTVPAIGPDGTPILVPADKVPQLVESGRRPMSADEAAAARQSIAFEHEHDPIEHPLRAAEDYWAGGLAGWYRGLTGGLSDVALIKSAEVLGGEEAKRAVRERLSGYERVHPVISTLEQMSGFGAAMATGRAGLGAAAARVAPGAAAAIEASGALGRVATGAAGGAAEGALFGSGSAVSEAALGDHDLTGEALIAGASHGAMWGAVAGGGLSALGRVGTALRPPKGTAAAYDALAARTFGEAADGVGEELAAKVSKPSAVDAAAGRYIAAHAGSEAEGAQLESIWKQRDAAFGDHAARIENASRRVTEAIDAAQNAARKVDLASFGDAKANQMARLVDESKFAAQHGAIGDFYARASQVVEDLRSDPTLGGTSKGALRKVDAYMTKLGKFEHLRGDEGGAGARLFTMADDFKRFLGTEAKFGRGPFGLTPAAREFDGLYRDLQKVLEDEQVWGAAGTAQQEINAATHGMLSEGARFRSRFTTKFGDTAGRPNHVADPSAVSGFMNRLTNASNDLDAKAVDAAITQRKRFLDAVSKHYDFGPEIREAVTTERKALDTLRSTVDSTTNDVAVANQARALLTEERAGLNVSGVKGLVYDAFAKPVTTLQRLASLEQNTQRVLARTTAGARKLAGVEAPGLAPPSLTGAKRGFFTRVLDDVHEARKAGPSAVRRIAPTIAAGGARLRSEFAKRSSQVTALSSNDAGLSTRVGAAIGTATDASPKTGAAATATALRGIAFLSSKLPPSRKDPHSLTPQLDRTPRVSDAEAARFLHYVEALDQPLRILDEAKAGTLTRDHVEAVKAVYPKLYEHIQVSVMEAFADAKQAPSYERRIQLGILLDIPTDKTLAPDFLRAVQATYTPAEKAGLDEAPPARSGKPLKIAETFATATQKAAEE